MPRNPGYKNSFDCIKRVYLEQGGVRALYRGALFDILAKPLSPAISFATKDFFNQTFTPTTGPFIAGVFAGSVQCFISYPLSVLEVKMECDISAATDRKYPNYRAIMSEFKSSPEG